MTDNFILINLGRRHHFNVLDVEKIKETEKAIQVRSTIHSKQTLWLPKKALKECNEVPGIFFLQSWFRFDEWGAKFLGHNMRHMMSTTWIAKVPTTV
jgi:hypothetical protein